MLKKVDNIPTHISMTTVLAHNEAEPAYSQVSSKQTSSLKNSNVDHCMYLKTCFYLPLDKS